MRPYPLKPLKWYKSLSSIKGRMAAGAFMVEGKKAVEHIWRYHPETIIEIIISNPIIWESKDHPIRILTERQFRSISTTKSPQGIMAILQVPEDIYSDRLPEQLGNKLLLLEHIQDPGNMGTLVRTAAAFDFSGIIMTDKCADPLSNKCVLSNAGTIFSLWMRRTSRYIELAEFLKENEYTIISTDLKGDENISPLVKQKKIVLALGNEATGLGERILKLSNFRISIPISREKSESLNVAVCGGICMYLSSGKGWDR